MAAYPAGGDPTAVLARRTFAYIVDILVVWGIMAAVFFAAGNVTEITDLRDCPATYPSGRGCFQSGDYVYFFDTRAVALAGLAALAYAVLVMWILQAATGATVGKAVFGVRTVDEAGGAPGFGKQAIRGLLWVFVDSFPYCCSIPLVGAISAGASKGHRRVGDMAAKTFVVRSADKGRPVVVPGLAATATAGAAPSPGFVPPAPAGYPTAPPTAEPPTTVMPPPAPGTASPGWAAPEPAPEAPVEAAPSEPAPAASADAPAEGPQWDDARGAYVQYDQARGAWLVYDQDAGEWKPI